MTSPAISVLIPAYNAAPFIRESINSILRQSERDLEIVLINDGSTDDTNEIALQLCATDNRIRYFQQENMGIVGTLNRGLELCCGEFVARMDADDIAHPARLHEQKTLLQANPGVVACGTEATTFGAAQVRLRVPHTDSACRSTLLLGPCFLHPTIMFRRTAVEKGVRYNPAFQYAEDYDFWCQLSAYGKLENINAPLLKYRLHSNQLSHTHRQAQMTAHLDIALAQLTQVGIIIPRESLRRILWPHETMAPMLSTLVPAFRLFWFMQKAGHLNCNQVVQILLSHIRACLWRLRAGIANYARKLGQRP